MFHGQELPTVPSGSRVSTAAEPARVATGESPGLLCQRRGRPSEPDGAGCGVWGRTARAAALRSADDDQGAGVRVLRGGIQFAVPRATVGRGRGVWASARYAPMVLLTWLMVRTCAPIEEGFTIWTRRTCTYC